MKRILSLLIVGASLMTACSLTQPGAATQPGLGAPTGAANALALPSATAAPNGAPTATRAPVNATPGAAVILPTAATAAGFTDLTLGTATVRVFAADLQSLTQADFSLDGQAPAGTVISVNDDFMVVGADQKFSFQLKLQEGPNLIEIEASDAQGQDASVGLVLMFDPTP